MTKRLMLARHARVESQFTGRFLGSSDVPLSPSGRRQAAALAGTLNTPDVDRLLVSPLLRATQTAEPLQIEGQIEPDLREIDFGRWEGLTFDEISAAGEDALIARWNDFDLQFSFPNGESLGSFVDRVARTADRLAAGGGKTTLLITHGGVIRLMICHLLGLSARNYLLFDVRPSSITSIDLFDGRGVLVGLNDVCHLKGVD